MQAKAWSNSGLIVRLKNVFRLRIQTRLSQDLETGLEVFLLLQHSTVNSADNFTTKTSNMYYSRIYELSKF